MANIIAKNYYLKYFYIYLFIYFLSVKITFFIKQVPKYVAKSHIHDEKDDMDVRFGFLSIFNRFRHFIC